MKLFQDARDYQILFLSLFLLLGFGTRDWTLKPEIIVTAIATCLVVQLVISHWSLVIGHRSLVIGHWSSVIGHRSLVI